MIYRAIGLMSGSSLDGLDLAFVEFSEQGGQWSFRVLHSACYPYSLEWEQRLRGAPGLSAREYLLLHSEYGRYTGEQVVRFMEDKGLQFQVALIASHGHTVFHDPARGMTAQLGDGATLAAVTGLPVISDLRSLDVALGGQGAPIVPIGEKLLFPGYAFFLNIGGIANISANSDPYIAFDVCPANRVLNLLAGDAGLAFDMNGDMAASGNVNKALLDTLNGLEYYDQVYPKSLANEFGTDTIYPLIRAAGISIPDSLRTFVEHIAIQVSRSTEFLPVGKDENPSRELLVTGGGALNKFLVSRIQDHLSAKGLRVTVPSEEWVLYKEAIIMAFIGVLRWRQEFNVLSSVTGASRNSIGGALWMGRED